MNDYQYDDPEPNKTLIDAMQSYKEINMCCNCKRCKKPNDYDESPIHWAESLGMMVLLAMIIATPLLVLGII